MYEEKLREDAVRAQGWEVVRWRWADLDDFTPVAARIREPLPPGERLRRPHKEERART